VDKLFIVKMSSEMSDDTVHILGNEINNACTTCQ